MNRKGVTRTWHATQRMKQRDIVQEEIVLTMHYGEKRSYKKGTRRSLLFKMTEESVREAARDGFEADDLEGLTVVTTKDGQTIITTYWDHIKPSAKPTRRKEKDDMRHALTLVNTQRFERFATCFPETEAWLNQHTRHQKAISGMVNEELESTGVEFRSVMDALFAFVFPAELPAMLDYYEDRGPQLVELHEEEVLERYDQWLLQFCKLCESTMDGGE